MANDKTDVALDEFAQQMEEEKKFSTLKKEVSRTKTLVDHQRYTSELERQRADEEDLEILKNANLDVQSDEQIAITQKKNLEYMQAAKNKLEFIMKDDEVNGTYAFNKLIPFFQKNLIFIGAKTGDGKSTTVANIALHTIKQKSIITGKNCRALIITNEEQKEDVYNRISCLMEGWSYTNHNRFTMEQIERMNKYIPQLSKYVTVVDNVHGGAHGVTTSIEGIEGIFENLINNGIHYDVIIIDYYQNVIESKKNTKLNEYDVQARLSRMLDRYKNEYPAPIVLLGQVNAPDEDGNPIFYWRIQGRKLIMTVSTCVIEMLVDKKHKVTRWFIWKSRFAETIGETIETGFKNGQFVLYTPAFAKEIQDALDAKKIREDNLQTDMNNGIKDVFDKKEDKK